MWRRRIVCASCAITGNDTRRVLLIEATYNSTLGNNLPLKAQAVFSIAELVGVS